MTMRPVPFRANHFFEIELQESQQYHRGLINPDELRCLESEYSYTLLDQGNVIACAGVMPFNRKCGRVWALLSRHATAKRFPEIHRWAKFFLNTLPLRRIEATAAADFPAASRWLEMLGFEFECVMRCFDERGADNRLYAIVREQPQ